MPPNLTTFELKVNRKDLIIIYPITSKKSKPNLDFYHLLTYLREKEIKYQWTTVEICAINGSYYKELICKLNDNLVFFYISNFIILGKLNTLWDKLKSNNCFILIGGFSLLTVKANDILSRFDSIGAIVRAPETEKVLALLLEGILENKSLDHLNGITFRQNATNKIITTPSPPLTSDLDLNFNSEFQQTLISNKEWYPLVTSTGCNYNCQYCGLQTPYLMNHSFEKNFWRGRSAKNIVDEIESVVQNGINKFSFYCQQFFNPREVTCANGHADKIASEILKRKLKIKFNFTAKTSELIRNFDTLSIFREAGLDKITIGIDSGLERFHKLYKTGSSVHENIEILKRMHECLFIFDISFIFFDPYLCLDEIKRNLAFLEKASFYLSHMPIDFNYFFYSGVLESALVLGHGMPIIKKLEKDSLVKGSRNISIRPEIKFKDSRVKAIYTVFKIISKSVIPTLIPKSEIQILANSNSFFRLFPFKMMEKILNDVTNGEASSISKYLLDTVVPYMKKIISAESGYNLSFSG